MQKLVTEIPLTVLVPTATPRIPSPCYTRPIQLKFAKWHVKGFMTRIVSRDTPSLQRGEMEIIILAFAGLRGMGELQERMVHQVVVLVSLTLRETMIS